MINVGILGFGYMGQIRKRCLDDNPDYVVKSIFHTEKVTGDFTYCGDIDSIINDPSINTVFICLPNFLTNDVVIRAMRADKHVFAEKPPGVSTDDVRQMMQVEKQTGKKLKFGFCLRYHPAIIGAKKLVDSGDFGNILWVRGRYGKSVDSNFNSTWRANKNTAGGGVLLDIGVHMLDLFLMFCGDFQEVKSFVSNCYWGGDVEDNVFAILRNDKNQTASLHSTITQWRYLFSLEIFLSEGYIVVDGLLSTSGRFGKEKLVYAINRTLAPQAAHPSITETIFDEDTSWDLELEEFAETIINNTDVKVGTTSDALKLMIIVDKIYEDGWRK